MIAYIAGLAPL